MTDIDRLISPCPPPPTAPTTKWPTVERSLGTPLPADYEQIADTCGPGAFCGFLHLYHPHAHRPWTSLTGPMPSTIRAQLRTEHERGPSPLPADPQDLLPARLHVSTTAASRHTAALRAAGLVVTERRGASVRHSRTPLGAALVHEVHPSA